MPKSIHISAPSRLHFGLWSLARGGQREYGGVGAMVAEPGLELRIAPADQFAANGPLAERAVVFAKNWATFHRTALPRCSIEVTKTPPQHAGLGTGTQLGLSVAAGLSALCGLPNQSPQELALSVGRGQRSAVGTYGFVLGGLIVEQGKLQEEPISPLDCRIDLPAEWRFVLVRPAGISGLAGDDERAAIDSLPAIPTQTTQRLIAEVRERLVPAAATGDFAGFADSVFRYGRESGQCFAARQGGPYNGPILTRLVEQIRELGGAGVGQSSWGPTLFVTQPSHAAAEDFASRLQNAHAGSEIHILITSPANRGARIEIRDSL
jgi:beta-RFAP synthase